MLSSSTLHVLVWGCICKKDGLGVGWGEVVFVLFFLFIRFHLPRKGDILKVAFMLAVSLCIYPHAYYLSDQSYLVL